MACGSSLPDVESLVARRRFLARTFRLNGLFEVLPYLIVPRAIWNGWRAALKR